MQSARRGEGWGINFFTQEKQKILTTAVELLQGFLSHLSSSSPFLFSFFPSLYFSFFLPSFLLPSVAEKLNQHCGFKGLLNRTILRSVNSRVSGNSTDESVLDAHRGCQLRLSRCCVNEKRKTNFDSNDSVWSQE